MRSQFEEDEILNELLDRIGDGFKIVTDIGARWQGSNSANLMKRGYRAILVDRDTNAISELRKRAHGAEIIQCAASVDNINSLVDANTHVLSIDVDSIDWWLWAALDVKPPVVVIEFNQNIGGHYIAPITCQPKQDGYGASIESMELLGHLKGYRLHARTYANAIFVRL